MLALHQKEGRELPDRTQGQSAGTVLWDRGRDQDAHAAALIGGGLGIETRTNRDPHIVCQERAVRAIKKIYLAVNCLQKSALTKY